MEKKNNGLVYCAVALFVMAFVLTLTNVFHINVEDSFALAFGYSGVDGEGGAVWAKVILIVLNLAGAAFLLVSAMNLIPKFPGDKFVPVACAAVCLVIVIIAWIVVPGLEEYEMYADNDMKVVMSFDGWMLMLTELAACGAAFMAGNKK